jgi:FkbM family methyltransferase
MSYILTTKNTQHQLPMDNQLVKDWINNPTTCANIIIKQINEDRMFLPFFHSDDFTILDLGANIGLFSLFVKDAAKRIISVEPTPKTLEVLTVLTADEPNIEILQAAASDTDGQTTFYINNNPTMNSLVNQYGESVTVNTYTFDSIMKKFNLDHIDFVKCDIEGGEMRAFNDDTLGAVADKIDTWAVEVHQTNVQDNPWPGNLEQNRQTLKALFQRHGYKTECIYVDQLIAWKE